MKKLFLLGAAGLMFAGVALAHDGNKGKKQKKCAKGKSCCSKETSTDKKACAKDKASKTAKL